MLVGEPGIGKTRTMQEVETYAKMRGAQVLWGRTHESAGAPPYFPWLQAEEANVQTLQMLRDDHKKVKALFKEFEEADDARTKKCIVGEACRELEVHTQIEEEVFYPAVRRDGADDDMMDEAEKHRVAKTLIAEFKTMTPSDESYDAKFTVLAENVKHHIDEEESEMLPKAAEAAPRPPRREQRPTLSSFVLRDQCGWDRTLDPAAIDLMEYIAVGYSGNPAIVATPKDEMDLLNELAAGGVPLLVEMLRDEQAKPLQNLSSRMFEELKENAGAAIFVTFGSGKPRATGVGS